MATNGGYRVNEDGSVTRLDGSGSTNGDNNNSNNNSGGDSDNSGCIWGIIIAVVIGIIIGIIIGIANSGSSDSDDYATDPAAIEENAVVAEAVAVEDTVAVEEAVAAEEVSTPSVTYLNVSDDDIYMSADGGSTDISVSSDGNWYIDVDAANWGHLTKYSNFVTLRVDRNNSASERTDYFIIRSGDYTRRINITQEGANTSPTADIERIWLDHNVYQNGQKGMKIHIRFTVDNMNGKTIYAYALFYWGDNTTPLHDQYGNNLSFYGYGTPSYDSARFDDFTIFVPHSGLNMQPGLGTVDLSFDISIRTSSGAELDRDNNTQITFSN